MTRARGVTLVELLIALAVTGGVLLAAAQLQSAVVRQAVTGDELRRVADRAVVLQRLLQDELGRAGQVPCGAGAPYREAGASGATALGALLSPPGLDRDGEALTVVRHDEVPAEAGGLYRELRPDGDELVLVWAEAPRWALDPPERVVAGDGCGLYGLEVLAGNRQRLRVRAPRSSEERAERGCALPEVGIAAALGWRDDETEESEALTVRRLRQEGGASGEGAASLDVARSARDIPEPVVRGVSGWALAFAECAGASDPEQETAPPGAFTAAQAVARWAEVCAVRISARVTAGDTRGDGPAVSWPVTWTVPLPGRLP